MGNNFLEKEKAEIYYHSQNINLLSHPNKTIHFSLGANPSATYTIPPRMRMAIPIPIKNPEKSEVYLPKMDLPKGVLGGKAVVSVEDNYATCMIINLNSKEVNINIEPQTLKEFDHDQHSSEGDDPDEFSRQDAKKLTDSGEKIKILLQKVPLDHLNKEEAKQIRDLMKKNHDVFYLPGDKLGCSKKFTCRIETTTDKLIRIEQYRFPPEHQEEIARQIEILEKQGIIRKSNSPYN